MRCPINRLAVSGVAALSAVFAAGCTKKAAEAPPSAAQVVPVSHPVVREVTDFSDYTGRTDAVQSVNVRSRVTGYLVKMPFEEGAEVHEGDVLFEVDPRPYQALVDQAQSQVTLYQAQYKLARTTYERDSSIGVGGAISQQQLDQDRAAVEEAQARIKVAEAALATSKLNLSFTTVKAPISGRISRYYYTLGNLVSQDQTLLTTIVSTDPMYAYFDVEERTFQRLVKSINLARARSTDAPKPNLPVFMAIEGEEGFPHKGTLNFINNQVNPSTGTIAVRGIFENTRPAGGAWSLIPGMFVRVRLPLGEPHTANLVIDKAIGSDQGLKFVYVVDAENKVQYRRVTTGPLQEDGLRVIEDGVGPDDWVVVGGIQQLRPKSEVQPDPTPMPTLAGGEAVSQKRKPQPPAPGEKKKR
jgi:RND family efflux transporter MFP subunit